MGLYHPLPWGSLYPHSVLLTLSINEGVCASQSKGNHGAQSPAPGSCYPLLFVQHGCVQCLKLQGAAPEEKGDHDRDDDGDNGYEDGDDDSVPMAVKMACFIFCSFEVAHCPDTFCRL